MQLRVLLCYPDWMHHRAPSTRLQDDETCSSEQALDVIGVLRQLATSFQLLE